MDQRRDFASPVYFNCTANDKGKLAFHELSTTGSDQVVEIGAIYIKATSFNQFDDRNPVKAQVDIRVGEAPLMRGSRTVEAFREFVELHRLNPREKIPFEEGNLLSVSGAFPDQSCVPGFDSGCETQQHGFIADRSGPVRGAHFVVDVAMSGFWPGQEVSGFMLLQILPESGKKLG